MVRYERKGHGGKEVTLIEKLNLSEDELDDWLKLLKNRLGCGGKRVETTLVVQGDQRKRVQAFLAERGVFRISIG